MAQYDSFAYDYKKFQDEFYRSHYNESRTILYSMLNFSLKRKRLLDLGCGFGTDLDYFQNKGAIVYGVDNSIKLIELARKSYPRLNHLSHQNFEKLSFANKSFDIVISRFSLQHSSHLEDVFEEIYRVLDSEGILVYLVGHPLMQFLCKKEKDYWKSEEIKVSLFDGKITVREPIHVFSEYLSENVLTKFDLLYFREGPQFGRKEVGLDVNVPDYFLVKMKKRE